MPTMGVGLGRGVMVGLGLGVRVAVGDGVGTIVGGGGTAVAGARAVVGWTVAVDAPHPINTKRENMRLLMVSMT
jgi:hypothetical protein